MGNHSDVAGVILAGGRSRRMGGGTKAFADLGGRPMLQRVIDRFRPQVGSLMLSVEQAATEWEAFGLEQVPDPSPGSNGPLGGLLATLERATELDAAFLVLVPCDAPFLPQHLVPELRKTAARQDSEIAVVRHAGRIQPVFSLWGTGLAGSVREAVTRQQMAGLMQFLRTQDHAILDWPEEAQNPFFNINDHAALQQARQRLEKTMEQEQCSV